MVHAFMQHAGFMIVIEGGPLSPYVLHCLLTLHVLMQPIEGLTDHGVCCGMLMNTLPLPRQ